MEQDAELRKDKLTALTQDYDHRFTELSVHLNRFQNHSRYLQLYVTVLVGVVGLILSGNAQGFLNNLQTGEIGVDAAYAIFLILAASLVFYLYSQILDALFVVNANGMRLAALEKKMNHLVGDTLLTWDLRISPHVFYSGDFARIGLLWIRPANLVAAWSFFLLLLIVVILSALCYILLPLPFFLSYSSIVFLLLAFHLYQVYGFYDKAYPKMWEKVQSLSEPSNQENATDTHESN